MDWNAASLLEPQKLGSAISCQRSGCVFCSLGLAVDLVSKLLPACGSAASVNKGEARNSLARAIFFNRLSEIRDRSLEDQRHRASGLNLVTAATTLWNAIYLERDG